MARENVCLNALSNDCTLSTNANRLVYHGFVGNPLYEILLQLRKNLKWNQSCLFLGIFFLYYFSLGPTSAEGGLVFVTGLNKFV